MVRVKVVGPLARKLGSELEAEVSEGATLGKAVQEIFRRFGLGEVDLTTRSSAHGFLTVLLNGKSLSFDSSVKEGDQIAFIPPLVGG
ncbi:MAG: MoaD/ThiS family protein [Candidatus Bathyarchaeia archaeon]